MRYLFAVRGPGDTGKTSTIRAFFQLFISTYPNSIVTHLDRSYREIYAIVTTNGVRIGIKSKGDPGTNLDVSLARFHNEDCEIIICACRTRGQTLDAVEEYRGVYEITYLDRSYIMDADERLRSIERDAHTILDSIRTIIPEQILP